MGMRQFKISERWLYNYMRRVYENVRQLYWYDAVIFGLMLLYGQFFKNPVLGLPLLGLATTRTFKCLHPLVAWFLITVISRPGRSQGLLYKQPRN